MSAIITKWKIVTDCKTCDGAGVLGIEYDPVSDTPCTDCGGDCKVVTYEEKRWYPTLASLHLDYPPDKIVSLELVSF
jgi:hypothetical protein